MHRIVPSVTTFEQHFDAIEQSPDVYRPPRCPHCGFSVLWRHGYYHRKADRVRSTVRTYNPIPICRYCCSGCRRTCSRLPLCIAPRRWYDWTAQQVALQSLLCGWSLYRCSSCLCFAQRTVQRWWSWLTANSETFIFFLRSRFPEWGRSIDAHAFWRKVLGDTSLAHAMAWLDLDLVIP